MLSGSTLNGILTSIRLPVYGSLVTTEAIWTPGEQFRQRVDELARWLVTCCLLLDPQGIVLVGRVATEAQPAVV